MTIPTVLTLLRMVLILPFLAAFYAPWPLAALILYVVASVTDWVDGWLARRSGTVTRIGAALDPIADKLLMAAALMMLMDQNIITDLWAVAAYVIVGREIYIAGLRGFVSTEQLPVIRLSKWKTAVVMAATVVLLAGWALALSPQVLTVGLWLLALGGVMSLITAAQYTIKALQSAS